MPVRRLVPARPGQDIVHGHRRVAVEDEVSVSHTLAQGRTIERGRWVRVGVLNLSNQSHAIWLAILGTKALGQFLTREQPTRRHLLIGLKAWLCSWCFSRLRYMFYGHPSGVQPAPCI